jgi:hypothetical protein
MHVFAAGLEIGQKGTRSLTFEIVDRQRHFHRPGHGDQNAARRWSSRPGHDDDHRVFEAGAGHDVARLEVQLQQHADGGAGATHSSSLAGSSAGNRRAVGQRHAQRFDAEAMVLAVYMPPQAPAPGQDLAHDVLPLVSSILPARIRRSTGRRDDVELFWCRDGPARIVPP